MADKKLMVVLGILVILFAVSLVMEYNKRSEPDNTEIIKIGKDELYCNGDSDCTLARNNCCYACDYGLAMNAKAAESIEKESAGRCEDVSCPILDCYLNACLSERKTEPKAACISNACVSVSSDIDCSKVCNSMSMAREEIQQVGCNPNTTSFESLYGACRCGN